MEISVLTSLRKNLLTFSFATFAFVCTDIAFAVPDIGTPVIALKQNCGSNQNCFTDATALLNWAWGTRQPTVNNPLVVEIDPGQYTVPGSTCDASDIPGSGYVTFRGAGRDNTVLTGGAPGFGVIGVTGCKQLNFQDLTIRTGTLSSVGTSQIGIIWTGGGSSTWTNIKVEASYSAWYDSLASGATCASTAGGRHEWYASNLKTTNGSSMTGYQSICGDNWIWGSEILVLNNGGSNTGTSYTVGVGAQGTGGRVHLYGTDVRVLTTVNATSSSPQMIGLAAEGGIIHIHGGEISVRSENPNITQNVTGASSTGAGGLVHTNDTSFGLLASQNGVASRVVTANGGKVDAPFQWAAGTQPPNGNPSSSNNLVSSNGQDMFIETDCGATGCHQAGNETHLLIYNNACVTSGPWFDVVTGKCRGL